MFDEVGVKLVDCELPLSLDLVNKAAEAVTCLTRLAENDVHVVSIVSGWEERNSDSGRREREGRFGTRLNWKRIYY
jgi:hypothetical protein